MVHIKQPLKIFGLLFLFVCFALVFFVIKNTDYSLRGVSKGTNVDRVNNFEPGVIYVVFVDGLSVEQKSSLFKKVGLNVPEYVFYPSYEFEINIDNSNLQKLISEMTIKLKNMPNVLDVRSRGISNPWLVEISFTKKMSNEEIRLFSNLIGGSVGYIDDHKKDAEIPVPATEEKSYIRKLLPYREIESAFLNSLESEFL